MASETIQNIIAQGEGYYTEFRRNLNSDLKKEMVAFANASGGNTFIGIDDNGTICGINITNQLISQVQEAANECDPPVRIETNTIDGNILQVRVLESFSRPHRTTSGFYLRTGANSPKMRTDTILEFMEKEGRVRFDERVRTDVDFDVYFSENQWQKFLRLAGISFDVEKNTVLQSLGAIAVHNHKIRFTNAALLIFTDSPTKFLHQSYITGVAYRTNDKLDIIDRKDFEDNLFSNIENALLFVERHINVSAKITGPLREDVWEIPRVALREAIVNAVVHRDYLETGARVVIEIFPGSITISNPGGLPKGMDEKDFGKYSLARNAVLANLLQRTRFIEKLGIGITRIRKETEKAGIPEVKFHFNSFFSVEFTRLIKDRRISIDEGLNEGLNEGLISVLAEIDKTPGIKAKTIAEILSRPIKTVERQIKTLSDKKIIERRGSRKTGGYFKINNKQH